MKILNIISLLKVPFKINMNKIFPLFNLPVSKAIPNTVSEDILLLTNKIEYRVLLRYLGKIKSYINAGYINLSLQIFCFTDITSIKKELKGISGIYFIINKSNGKGYIGSAENLSRRFQQHIKGDKSNSNNYLQNSISNHGGDLFYFMVVCYYFENPFISLIEIEQLFLDISTFKYLYNICQIAGSRKGVKATPQTRVLFSASKFGKKLGVIGPLTPEIKDLISASRGTPILIYDINHKPLKELCSQRTLVKYLKCSPNTLIKYRDSNNPYFFKAENKYIYIKTKQI